MVIAVSLDASNDHVSTFLEAFSVGARQAGALARHLQGHVANEGKAGGGTPEADALSAVDLAAQDVLLELLFARLPEVAVDAEEDTASTTLFPPEGPDRDLVVIDPIDGTLSYLMGTKDWAVMGGLIRDGRFVAAIVYYPAHDVMVSAVRGDGCRVGWGRESPRPLHLAEDLLAPPVVMVGPRFPAAATAALEHLGLTPEVCRCSAVEAGAPLLGRGLGAMTHHPIDRRHGIPAFASLEAGATVLFGSTPWQGEDPASATFAVPTVVAARAEDAERWMSAVRATGEPRAGR